MFSGLFADTQRQMQGLLEETRTFAGLQKKVLMVETRDKLSIILSRLAIAIVCLVLGGMVLLFLSFALAYWIGQLTENVALGFGCVTAFILLLLGVFWYNRQAWVILPLTNMLTTLFTPDDTTLTGEQAAAQLGDSRARLSEGFGQLVNPVNEADGQVQSLSNWVSRGFAVYEGVRMGLSVMRALSSIFGRRKRRLRR